MFSGRTDVPRRAVYYHNAQLRGNLDINIVNPNPCSCYDLEILSSCEKLGAANKRIPMDISPSTSALCIVAPLNAGQFLRGLFSTHPPIEDRIALLQAMTITR